MGRDPRDAVMNDGDDAKPWALPFWTEEPGYALERDNLALVMARREARDRMASRRGKAPEPPVPETDEVEIILPTAEELENIRREAWNAGLEQGLVEGRQEGHKAGYDTGFAEGRKAGHDKGLNEGKGEGLKQGRDEGLAKARQEIDDEVRALQALQAIVRKSLLERDLELPEVLATLIQRSCEQVLGYELQDGARRILDYVNATIARLPESEQNQVQIWVSPADAACLDHHLLETGLELHYRADSQLSSGECRIQSPHSRAEFSLYDQLQHVMQETLPLLEQAAPNMEQAAVSLEQELSHELEWQHQELERKAEEAERLAAEARLQAEEAERLAAQLMAESDASDHNEPELALESQSVPEDLVADELAFEPEPQPEPITAAEAQDLEGFGDLDDLPEAAQAGSASAVSAALKNNQESDLKSKPSSEENSEENPDAV
ncbi:FliH/SctL family protein [Parathalassolituus penaei]|uniref:Flagellar assembly protein FliH n=1 Tax=Parathalassolituus penaei TaxID=2997323 RepID=A0A9X3ITM3_9GAMM|nr:FliH/SctL family protein [Parathalassolituus penaei]MCY0966039.1 FliH/SctL family protein [Parathalassolituus penaei]